MCNSTFSSSDGLVIRGFLPALPIALRVHAPYEKFQCFMHLHFVAIGAVFPVLCRRLQESDVFLKKHYCSRNRSNSHLFSPPSECTCPTFRQFLLLSSSSGRGLLSDDWGAVGEMYRKQLIIIKSAVVRRTSSWLGKSMSKFSLFYLSVPPDWICTSETVDWQYLARWPALY